MPPAYNTRSAARAAKAESSKSKNVDDKEREMIVMLRRIQQLFPTARRIAITTSALAQGVHFKWTFNPSDGTSKSIKHESSVGSSVASSSQLQSEASISTEASESSHAPSTLSRSSSLASLLSLSSLSSLEDDEDAPQSETDENPHMETPRQGGPGNPGTALRTPRKAFPGRPLRRGPAPYIDWNAEHSPDQSRLQGNHAHPMEEVPARLVGHPGQGHGVVSGGDVLEDEQRRGRELHEARTYREQMAILKAHSRVQQRALRLAQEAGTFDEDEDGKDVSDMEVDEPIISPSNQSQDPRAVLASIPVALTAQMTSDVLLELPSSYPRQATARFYRDTTGRWQLEGDLETELLTEICSNHREMMESAFRLNCREWRYLQRNTVGPAMARVRAPLTEDDVKAMQAQAAMLAAQNQPLVRKYTETRLQPVPPGILEPQAGPSRLTREDTEIIDIDVSVHTVSQPRSFPGGRRIQ